MQNDKIEARLARALDFLIGAAVVLAWALAVLIGCTIAWIVNG